ncbi:MAG: hypothetical protein CUN57_02805, partial [Phototrophicales bacterium]
MQGHKVRATRVVIARKRWLDRLREDMRLTNAAEDATNVIKTLHKAPHGETIMKRGKMLTGIVPNTHPQVENNRMGSNFDIHLSN